MCVCVEVIGFDIIIMSDDFEFNIHNYLYVDNEEQRILRSDIRKEELLIEEKCKNEVKGVKQQELLKDKKISESVVLNELKEKLSASGGVQYETELRRDGVLCYSNMYGLLYVAKKRDLYIVSSSTLQKREDLVPVRSFNCDITQLSLSSSELYLSITLIDTIEIFETRELRQHVSNAVSRIVLSN